MTLKTGDTMPPEKIIERVERVIETPLPEDVREAALRLDCLRIAAHSFLHHEQADRTAETLVGDARKLLAFVKAND